MKRVQWVIMKIRTIKKRNKQPSRGLCSPKDQPWTMYFTTRHDFLWFYSVWMKLLRSRSLSEFVSYNEILMYNVINTQAVFSFLFFNVIPDFSFSFRLFNFIAVQVFLVHFYSLPVMKNKQTKRKTQRLHQWNCACWLGIPLYPHCVISQHNSTRWKTERWTVYLWVSSSVRHNPPHFSETPHLGNV